jgi:RNA polymerase sigma factor (TIGR02999 family)
MSPDPSQITHLLHRWSDGDREALDELIPIVYERLHHLAHQRLRHEPSEQSLNTTGLVHEAYVKLVQASECSFKDRNHFLAVASRVMRHLLVDRARGRNALKRGGGRPLLPLQDDIWAADRPTHTVLELDGALKRLELLDARQSAILEQRYFGGLSLEETAGALNISIATVTRDLRSARAWLAAELGGVAPP